MWQRCERCSNVLSSIWPAAMARSIEQRGHHVTCALIGTSRKLAAYNYASSLALEQRLSTSWWIQLRYPKGRSRTCYQECGCHLNKDKTLLQRSQRSHQGECRHVSVIARLRLLRCGQNLREPFLRATLPIVRSSDGGQRGDKRAHNSNTKVSFCTIIIRLCRCMIAITRV